MSATTMQRGHSSNVQLRLEVDQHIVRLAQVGEKWLILAEPFECPPESEGRVVIVVDGHRTVHPVILDSGIRRDVKEVKFSDISSSPTQGFLFDDMGDKIPF